MDYQHDLISMSTMVHICHRQQAGNPTSLKFVRTHDRTPNQIPGLKGIIPFKGNIFENGERNQSKKHAELTVSACGNGLFVKLYVGKSIVEAGILFTLKNEKTGTAEEFKKKKDERQCKNSRPHCPGMPQRLRIQISPDSARTGPTPPFADMF